MNMKDGEITDRQKSKAFRLSSRTEIGVMKRANQCQIESTHKFKLDEGWT